MNVSELIGTFCLVLVGPGAVVVGLSNLGISIAFGSIVTLMILCFGKVSGAHINPAVSIAFYLIEKEKRYLGYTLFQLIGGLLAGVVLLLLFPTSETYGETLPKIGVWESFALEVFITFILMLSILLIIKFESLILTAFVVGFVVFLAAYFAGPHTGASMNPARTFGPAVVSDQLNVLWIYFIAPVIGAVLAVFFLKLVRKNATK